MSQLIACRELRDCSVKLGWRRRERLFVFTYDDGSRCVGYPVPLAGSFVVVELLFAL